jgi:hypothetical protein
VFISFWFGPSGVKFFSRRGYSLDQPPERVKVLLFIRSQTGVAGPQKITRSAAQDLAPLQEEMSRLLDCDPRQEPLREQFEQIVRKWLSQVQRLGLRVSGLWEVGFDTGDGYLSWRYPELRLAYFRYYEESFSRRRPLGQVIEEDQPEWAHQ